MEKNKVAAGAAVVTGAVSAAGPILSGLGISSVPHAAGGFILTGANGYIAGTLGLIGAAVGTVSAPVVTVGAGLAAAACAGFAAYSKMRR